MKINSKNKVNGNNNNTNNKKKLIVLMTIVIITIITIKKNIIFSIRNNELTHYMSIFVVSLIRDHTKTRAEATVAKNLAQQKRVTYFLINGIQPKKDLKFKKK